MSGHTDGLVGEIMYMQTKMGEDADLDFSENLDDFEDHLYDLSTEELYDTYSMVNRRYERWMKQKKETVNDANAT